MASSQRQAKTKSNIKRNTRTSRAAESRVAEPIHEEYEDDWEEPDILSTKNIPPRPGKVHRWIRTELGGREDYTNIGRAINAGWRPRPAESVSANAQVLTVENSRLGGNVIGIEGMILMERDERRSAAVRRANQQAARDQMRAVNSRLSKVHTAGAGFGAPEIETSSRVEKGRPVQVADD